MRTKPDNRMTGKANEQRESDTGWPVHHRLGWTEYPKEPPDEADEADEEPDVEPVYFSPDVADHREWW